MVEYSTGEGGGMAHAESRLKQEKKRPGIATKNTISGRFALS
mgnify:CR=1 FL=1